MGGCWAADGGGGEERGWEKLWQEPGGGAGCWDKISSWISGWRIMLMVEGERLNRGRKVCVSPFWFLPSTIATSFSLPSPPPPIPAPPYPLPVWEEGGLLSLYFNCSKKIKLFTSREPRLPGWAGRDKDRQSNSPVYFVLPSPCAATNSFIWPQHSRHYVHS